MYTFLIQIVDNEIIHDFSFHLKEAIKYNNWFFNEKKYDYILCEHFEEITLGDKEKYIPIGSINFVLNFYKIYFDINLQPINIPLDLYRDKYLKRNVITNSEIKIENPDKIVFAKSLDKFKDFTELIKIKNLPLNKKLLISDEIEILSEWRIFVFNKKMVDIKNYSGDFKCFPNINIIEQMINDYKDCPKSYTLDIAITPTDTVLIEVHQFFSCGLYGFNDYSILPKMFIATHKDIMVNSQ